MLNEYYITFKNWAFAVFITLLSPRPKAWKAFSSRVISYEIHRQQAAVKGGWTRLTSQLRRDKYGD